jgi:hypothetical protein
MKRIVCLLLVVSIAFAGCYDVEIDKITGKPISDKGTEVPKQNKERIATQTPYSRDWWGDWESFSELIQRIERVEGADKLLLVKIADLEAELESQKAEEKADKALLVRIADLEATIESQTAEIESSTNAYCLYEVAIESQRVTIESLEKLCRMYEAEIESQGKSRSSEESPLGKEPEAGQHQGQE